MSVLPLIRINHLMKHFGAVEVLKGVDVNIFENEIFGFLGTNGSGKSTTINIMTNQITADSGTIEIAGQPTSSETNRMIGLAPQEIAIYPHLSVYENLNFFAGVYGLSGGARRRSVDQILDRLNLRTVRRKEAATLSGGWQRRLNLAIALVHQPKIAILDEPTVGMDVEARFQMWEAIRALKAEDVTVILTTHLMDEAETLCDRIGILHEGEIAALGTMDELRVVVPAVEMAEVECSDMEALKRRAEAIGLTSRVYAGRLTLLLPERFTIRDLVERLAPLEVRSVRLRNVSLSDVFLEIVSTSVSKMNQRLQKNIRHS